METKKPEALRQQGWLFLWAVTALRITMNGVTSNPLEIMYSPPSFAPLRIPPLCSAKRGINH